MQLDQLETAAVLQRAKQRAILPAGKPHFFFLEYISVLFMV